MGWESLIATTAMARQLAEQEVPVACWRCGTPLEQAPDGGLFCRADGWRPDDLMGELRP